MISAPTEVRTVLRLFQYAPLNEFVGRRFTVATHETLRNDVSKLGFELATHATLLSEDVRNLYLQIAKYGILDIRFGVSRDTFACEFQSGKKLIRELGFGPDSSSKWTEVCPEFEGLIPDIAAEVHENRWFFMIYAEIVGDIVTGHDLFVSITKTKDLSKLPLPAEFKIVDACVTNSTWAWFAKHFYV